MERDPQKGIGRGDLCPTARWLREFGQHEEAIETGHGQKDAPSPNPPPHKATNCRIDLRKHDKVTEFIFDLGQYGHPNCSLGSGVV
jgi:hypothetical protein